MSNSSCDCTSLLYCHNLLFFFVISGNGTGSIFWFCVPTCMNEAEKNENMIDQGKDTTKPEVSEQITGNAQGNIIEIIPEQNRIGIALILGDSRSIRKILQKGLQMNGYRVLATENFSQGLQEMKATGFDLVFCDFLMPESHGLKYLKQYREWEQLHRKSQTVRSCHNAFVSHPYSF